MKIQYFHDTDTLYIEFKNAEVTETRDLDEDTLLDLDQAGNIRGNHGRACERFCETPFEGGVRRGGRPTIGINAPTIESGRGA